MLQVKSCNVKHNSESVFRYFASAKKQYNIHPWVLLFMTL